MIIIGYLHRSRFIKWRVLLSWFSCKDDTGKGGGEIQVWEGYCLLLPCCCRKKYRKQKCGWLLECGEGREMETWPVLKASDG